MDEKGKKEDLTFDDVKKIVQYYYRIHREHTQVIYEVLKKCENMLTTLLCLNAASFLLIVVVVIYFILFR